MRYPPLTGGAGPETARAWPGRAPLPPLVAVAHGSADPRAAAEVTDLMAVVRARARRAGLEGLQARAAYLGHALPSLPDALEALSAWPGPPGRGGRPSGPAGGEFPVVVLPLLLTEAYHSDTDMPAMLREAAGRLPRLRISYGDPLGPHSLLLRALERRLAEAGVRTPGSDTAVVLAAAGSSRPAADASVARVAAAWRSAGGWRGVTPAFASAAAPTPAEAVTRLLREGAPRVVVASYLLAPGYFADQVRRTCLAAGAGAVSAPLGAAPEVADVVLERYAQACEFLRAAISPRAATV